MAACQEVTVDSGSLRDRETMSCLGYILSQWLNRANVPTVLFLVVLCPPKLAKPVAAIQRPRPVHGEENSTHKGVVGKRRAATNEYDFAWPIQSDRIFPFESVSILLNSLDCRDSPPCRVRRLPFEQWFFFAAFVCLSYPLAVGVTLPGNSRLNVQAIQGRQKLLSQMQHPIRAVRKRTTEACILFHCRIRVQLTVMRYVFRLDQERVCSFSFVP